MIIKSTPEDGVVPHRENIRVIHESLPILPILSDLDPIYAGGYAMALLFAPRAENGTTIQSKYYGDYDIYFSNIDTLDEAQGRLASVDTVKSCSETDNAHTYSHLSSDGKYNPQLQLIKIATGNPSIILKEFDFINCAVAYTPLNQNIYFHKDTISLHHDRSLGVLKPRYIPPRTEDDVIVQLARIQKYCMRWEYRLSNTLYDLLIELYNEYPNLIARQGQVYYSTFSSYRDTQVIGTCTENIWTILAPLIRAHPNWINTPDIHNIITRAPLEYRINSILEART